MYADRIYVSPIWPFPQTDTLSGGVITRILHTKIIKHKYFEI